MKPGIPDHEPLNYDVDSFKYVGKVNETDSDDLQVVLFLI